MTRTDILNFEILVMVIAEAEKCKTAEDYEKLAQQLHESVETATRPDRRPDWCPLVEVKTPQKANKKLLEESGFEL